MMANPGDGAVFLNRPWAVPIIARGRWEMEQDLAEDLRRTGYTIMGGHKTAPRTAGATHLWPPSRLLSMKLRLFRRGGVSQPAPERRHPPDCVRSRWWPAQCQSL